MDSLQTIKRRIRGVKNINQITKAMELVAATKMRKSQEIALASRGYAFAALDLLSEISRIDVNGTPPPLLESRPIESTAYVLITSDKGLAGSFNATVIRAFEEYLRQNNVDLKGRDHFVAIGQKATNYLEHRTSNLDQRFVRVGDYTTVEEVSPIAEFLIRAFLDHRFDRVVVFSMHFKSALLQIPIVQEIFPVNLASIRATVLEMIPETGRFSELRSEIESRVESQESREYAVEPSPQAVLDNLIEHLITMQIYHLILEANAAEHAARRVAMKNASDNAEELAGDLTLAYNKSRQAAITKEILEISAGAEALQ